MSTLDNHSIFSVYSTLHRIHRVKPLPYIFYVCVRAQFYQFWKRTYGWHPPRSHWMSHSTIRTLHSWIRLCRHISWFSKIQVRFLPLALVLSWPFRINSSLKPTFVFASGPSFSSLLCFRWTMQTSVTCLHPQHRQRNYPEGISRCRPHWSFGPTEPCARATARYWWQ